MRIQYLEIVTRDVDAVCAAYSSASGVQFGEPDPGLGNARAAKLVGGGLVGVRAPLRKTEAPVVRPYWLVQDIEAALAAAVEAGGKVAHPPMEITGHGTFAIYLQGGNDSRPLAADTTHLPPRCLVSRLIVHSFTISLDGYGAGPNQSKETPLGEAGEELHEWLVGTRFFKQMGRREGGASGIDNDFAEHGMANIGAFILGRNMFGPIRGPWPDESWRGWWGENPPYHAPTFVLTHHPRSPQGMEGGTVFHFVTDGIRAALDHARSAAGDKDVRLLGGAATIRQYLEASLVDEMHIAVSPRLLGAGEPLFTGLDLPRLGYRSIRCTPGEKAVHYVIARG